MNQGSRGTICLGCFRPFSGRGQRLGSPRESQLDVEGQTVEASGSARCGTTAVLPDGWAQATDPASGRRYYYHTLTRVASWVPPATAHPAAHGPPQPSLQVGPLEHQALQYLAMSGESPAKYMEYCGKVEHMDASKPGFLGNNLWAGMRRMLTEYPNKSFSPHFKGWFVLPQPFSKEQALQPVEKDDPLQPRQYYPAYFERQPSGIWLRMGCLNILFLQTKLWWIHESRMVSEVTLTTVSTW